VPRRRGRPAAARSARPRKARRPRSRRGAPASRPQGGVLNVLAAPAPRRRSDRARQRQHQLTGSGPRGGAFADESHSVTLLGTGGAICSSRRRSSTNAGNPR
jgi:hypothetical protein